MKIIKGKVYQWQDKLLVLALTTESFDVDPNSDTYKEYTFKGRILHSDKADEYLSVDFFIADGFVEVT